jgi:dTDP-4-dehydrorhamnose 3,5-epimerase
MNVIQTVLPGVLIFEPRRIGDARGFFVETFRADRYAEAGLPYAFVQDNWSRSVRKVLRGLHLQNPNSQGKLVGVVSGEIFDVAVDVRIGSPTFGKYVGVTLSAENGRQFFVPRGFAHGFQVVSESADFLYKCDGYYSPADERIVRWDDPTIGIKWPFQDPTLSDRDAKAPLLAEAAGLPRFEG